MTGAVTHSATTQLELRRLDDFCQRLAAHPRRRMGREAIWAAYSASFPDRPQGAPEREWLLAALTAAESRGVIRLPAASSSRWDRRRHPYVPISVDRLGQGAVTPADPVPPWRRFPWHPALAWVADLLVLAEEEHAILLRVHDGLVGGTFTALAPVKYRSLELTGDEKRLEQLARGRLFGEGRLSLSLLGCASDRLPIAWERVGARSTALVLENHASFGLARSVLRAIEAARGPSASPYGVVAFGSGKSVKESIAWLSELDCRLEQVHYVGDLDWPGLEAAILAGRTARSVGLPPLEPAPGVHAAMLAAAAGFGSPEGWPYAVERTPVNAEVLLAWLPEDVRPRAEAVLRAGRRIPEEVLGPDALHALWHV